MLLFFSIFFSFSVFSSNINLFNEAKNIEKQEVKILSQQSEKLATIAAKLNELQTSQQTILFLLSPEETDFNKAPITEVVIEPDTDRDYNIALEENLNIWREQLFPMTKNMFLIDDNWLIVFKPSKDSFFPIGDFVYTDIEELEKHKLLVFYRTDSDSSFNLLKEHSINLNSVPQTFKGFLKHKDGNKIYLLFDGYMNNEFYIYSIENLFFSNPSLRIVESTYKSSLSPWLAEKGFSKSSSKDIFNKCFTFIDKRVLFSSLLFLKSIEQDLEKIFCEIKNINKDNIEQIIRDIKNIKNICVKTDSNQIDRILKEYPKDSHKYQLLISYLTVIKQEENDIEKFILLQKEYLPLKKHYELMYEIIKTFEQKINYEEENLLYSVITNKKRIGIAAKIKKFLEWNKQEDYNLIIEQPSLISKTDEQIVQEFEDSLKKLITLVLMLCPQQ